MNANGAREPYSRAPFQLSKTGWKPALLWLSLSLVLRGSQRSSATPLLWHALLSSRGTRDLATRNSSLPLRGGLGRGDWVPPTLTVRCKLQVGDTRPPPPSL